MKANLILAAKIAFLILVFFTGGVLLARFLWWYGGTLWNLWPTP
jgi:hypothetical protein